MALAVAVRFDFIYAKGKTSFTKIRVPTGFTIAQYQEYGEAKAQLISNISSCRITNASLTFSIALGGLSLKTVAAAVADVSQKGYFAFASAVNGFFKRFRIPTFDEARVNANSDTIDTIHASVAAFQAAMENGIVVTGGTIQPTTERVQSIVSLSDAREVFRKRRR